MGIREDTFGEGKTFIMPDPLPEHLGLSLTDILNPRNPEEDVSAMPKALGAARNVQRGSGEG